MSNTITNVLPSMLAQGVLALRQNSLMPQLVNRDYQNMVAQKGNVITVPIPSSISARDVTPAVAFASNVDSSPTAASITLDSWKEAPFQMSDSDYAAVIDGFISMQQSEAIKSLANAADSFLLGKHTGIFGLAGTPGTTPFSGSLNMVANADMKLNRQLAPVLDRRGVIDPLARQNLILNTQVLQADQRGDTGGIITGTIGTKLGFDWYMDQNIVNGGYTPGTGWASGFIASTVAGAVGDTTLNVINATASGQVKIGDIFSLVADTASNQYVITVTTTVSATVQSVITFYPGLKTSVNTGATLLVVSATYTPNLAFHRDAFAFAARPLQPPTLAGNIVQAPSDPVSGLALRLELSRQYKQTTFSYDILYGGALVRKELACKIAG